MLAFQTVLTFFLTSVLLALAPGPDNLFVLTQSAIHGPRAGILVTLGLCTGLIFHTAAVAVGVAALFRAVPAAFLGLRFLGAAYLLWLGWQAFRETRPAISHPVSAPWTLYRRGFLMNVTNPKVSIFFLAFLPQFADPKRGLTGQILLLGLLFCLAAILVFGLIALLGGTLRIWLAQSNRMLDILNKAAGVVYIGIALRLLGFQN